MSDLIGKSLGRYHILEQLGEGGMATVYKAFDTQLERNVAVKVILPHKQQSEKFLKRFEREARALARLSHPNIIKILDYGTHKGMPYLVMEFVEGETLKQRLTNPFQWTEAVEIVAVMARALDSVHRQKIIHRDIKPSNILIDHNGRVYLSDFGVARLLDDEETSDLTGTGVGVGTPEYMSPEQVMGHAVDGRSDIYSLGIVLYQLVTGRTPFRADTPMAVGFKQVSEPLPRPRSFSSNIPEPVEQTLIKALAKQPENRYQSMGEFAQALERLMGNLPAEAAGWKESPRTTSTPPRWTWMAAGSLAVILLGGLVLLRSRPAPMETAAPSTDGAARPTATRQVVTSTPQATSTPDPRAEHRVVARCGGKSICIEDGLGRQIQRIDLPELPGSIRDMAWSPDGSYILFDAERGAEDWHGDLYSYHLTTGILTRYTDNTRNNNAATGSPDGTRIAAHSGCSLLIFDIQARSPEYLVNELEYCVEAPRWAPDGIWIAWVSPQQKDGDTDRQSIQMLNTVSKEILTLDIQMDQNAGFQIAWDPSGRYLYFQEDGLQIVTSRLDLSCRETGCTNPQFEMADQAIPASWLPDYFPQWLIPPKNPSLPADSPLQVRASDIWDRIKYTQPDFSTDFSAWRPFMPGQNAYLKDGTLVVVSAPRTENPADTWQGIEARLAETDSFAASFTVQILESPRPDGHCMFEAQNDKVAPDQEKALMFSFYNDGIPRLSLGIKLDGVDTYSTIAENRISADFTGQIVARIFALGDAYVVYVNDEFAYEVAEPIGRLPFTKYTLSSNFKATCSFGDFKFWDLGE